MSARVRLRTYVVFAEALAESVPYDVGGAFALLQDVEHALGRETPTSIDVAIRAHLAAALSRKTRAFALARYALISVAEELERRLTADAT